MTQVKKGFSARKNKTKGEMQDAYEKRILQLEQVIQNLAPVIFQHKSEIQRLKDEQAAYLDILRFEEVKTDACKAGDKIMIDFVGRFKNEDGTPGERFKDGTSLGFTFELGTKRIVQDLEDALIGMKAGEFKQVNITFPEEYREDLKGKDVIFDVELVKVYKKSHKGKILELLEALQQEETPSDEKEIKSDKE